MRIGLYGLPTAGKSFILNKVRNFEVVSGSAMLNEICPGFENVTNEKRKETRKELARMLRDKDKFIIDGHYSFGEDVVFTEEDGKLYDTFLYMFVNPEILNERMSDSIRNNKYLKYDLEKWQNSEIEGLRLYCQKNNKDFYVIDNPEEGFFSNIGMVLEFIDSIAAGYSCVAFAQECVDKIMKDGNHEICLVDGDKTLLIEDSCDLLGYSTHLFDGNYYTGFQIWRHYRELTDYLQFIGYMVESVDDMELHMNTKVVSKIDRPAYILTSGYFGVWNQIASKMGMDFFWGDKMSADTKYFITKFLQEKGIRVVAYGDSMNDYFMLKQADDGCLVVKDNGSLSRSLKNQNLEGLTIV